MPRTVVSIWLAQVRQSSYERPTKTAQGSALDEDLRKSGGGKPRRVLFDDVDDVGRAALDRQLTRPHEARVPLRGQADSEGNRQLTNWKAAWLVRTGSIPQRMTR